MSNPIYPQIITGVFTLAAALGAVGMQQWANKKQRRNSVRRALLTEVESIASMIRRRGYREALRKGAFGSGLIFDAEMPVAHRVVYDSLISEIGLLNKSEVSDINKFYMNVMTVNQDIRPNEILGEVGTKTKDFYAETLAILDEAMEISERLARTK